MLTNLRKRTFEDVTFIAAISTPENVLSCCLEDHFAIFDFHSLKKSSYRFKGSSRCVAMDYARSNTNCFISADFDGKVRLWDLRNPRYPSSTSGAGSNFLPPGATFNTAAVSPNAQLICAGSCVAKSRRRRGNRLLKSTNQHSDLSGIVSLNYDDVESASAAYVICWDTRTLQQPLLILNDLHSDDINHMCFDPSPSVSAKLLSCADDGLVCLTDLTAPADDRLLMVFNAERQVNYCGFLYPPAPSVASQGIYSLDNMRSHFTAWPLSSEEDGLIWQKLRTPAQSRSLLSAARLPSSQPAVCLLSTSYVKRDLRLALVDIENTKIVARRRLFQKGVKLDSDAFYADVLNLQTLEEAFEILVMTRHSIHRFQAKLIE